MEQLYQIDGGVHSSNQRSPKRTRSLLSRRSPLAEPRFQLKQLATHAPSACFDTALNSAGFPSGLNPSDLEIFQINLGKLCNMTCQHCHVDAGPDRIAENMSRETVDAC